MMLHPWDWYNYIWQHGGFVYSRDTKEASMARVGWAMGRGMKDVFVWIVEVQVLEDLTGQWNLWDRVVAW